MKGFATRSRWAGTLGLLLLTLLASGCISPRGREASLLLADLAAGSRSSRLKELTPVPERSSIAFAVNGRSYRADLYRPGQGALAGILLIPGAAEAGKDDPRLVAFAHTLARARFTVLVPDFASLRQLHVSSANVQEVADVLAWFADQPELTAGARPGMVAFSYAAGPAILAALQPKLRERVGFILAVGPYHDLGRVLTFSTTGWFQDGDDWRYLEPNDYGKWVFVLSNLDRVDDAGDRRRLRAMAERRRTDPKASLADLAPGLTEEGAQILAFIVNRDPQRAPELLQQLPAAFGAEIAALTLADKPLAQLRARLLLVHGYDDSIIPHTESQALAAAAGEGTRLFLVHGLAHVDLELGLWSRLRLWQAIMALLAERDDPAPR